MALHSSPSSRKRQRIDSPSPESAPARKTLRSQPKATSTSISTSASETDHGDMDTTMEDADDSVLIETSAPVPPPQHHHTHLVTGTRPTQDEIYGTAERAQTLTTDFDTYRASTPPSQTDDPSSLIPYASDSCTSILVAGALFLGPSHEMFRPAGARSNSPKTSPISDPGCRPPAKAVSVGSSSRCSSHVRISPAHHHMAGTYSENRRTSPSKQRRPSLQQAQSLRINHTPFSLANHMAEQTFGSTTSPALWPAAYISHRGSFLGASTIPSAADFANRGGAGLEFDCAPSHYRRPTAESEDEIIPERPLARRIRETSQDLLRAQEAVKRQKEEDADDELAEQEAEDVDEDDEFRDREDGMDLN